MSTPRSTPAKKATAEQSTNQDEQRAVQEGTPNVIREVQQGVKPTYPTWPTSKPGPHATTPPPGMRPINPIRAEQVVEVGYNQATGEPATQDPVRYNPDEAKVGKDTSFDQQVTAQDILKRGKERL